MSSAINCKNHLNPFSPNRHLYWCNAKHAGEWVGRLTSVQKEIGMEHPRTWNNATKTIVKALTLFDNNAKRGLADRSLPRTIHDTLAEEGYLLSAPLPRNSIRTVSPETKLEFPTREKIEEYEKRVREAGSNKDGLVEAILTEKVVLATQLGINSLSVTDMLDAIRDLQERANR